MRLVRTCSYNTSWPPIRFTIPAPQWNLVDTQQSIIFSKSISFLTVLDHYLMVSPHFLHFFHTPHPGFTFPGWDTFLPPHWPELVPWGSLASLLFKGTSTLCTGANPADREDFILASITPVPCIFTLSFSAAPCPVPLLGPCSLSFHPLCAHSKWALVTPPPKLFLARNLISQFFYFQF